MSLYLLYFDDGPLWQLAGNRGGVFYDEGPALVRYKGEPLTTRALAICHEFSSGPFRTSFDPKLHRELFLFLVERVDHGKSPRLLFHWETNEDALEVTEVSRVVDRPIADVADLFEALRKLPNDEVLRVSAIQNPIRRSVPELIDEMLADGSLPWFDGIVHAGGEIVLMEHRLSREDPAAPPAVRALARSHLTSFLAYNPHRWRDVEPLGTIDSETAGIRLTYGKGRHWGTAGFITVRDLAGGSLRWAAFFEESGAFEAARIDAGVALATSASGHRWRFPLDQPDLVRVTE